MRRALLGCCARGTLCLLTLLAHPACSHTALAPRRLSLPHALDLLTPECIEAWALRVPIHREEEVKRCWSMGWDMYN